LKAIQGLDAVCKERFAKDAPSFRDLRVTVEAVQGLAKDLLRQKLEKDPDPPSAAPVEASDESAPSPAGDGAISATVSSAADAERRVVSAASFLRKANPLSPTPYLLLRALRWGELRASGVALDAKLLTAPDPASRWRLRSLFLDERWEELLEACELVMGTPVGRGWLDLQFYAIRSAVALGEPYDDVASVLTTTLRHVLADVPSLRTMTLMDAMPTATPETQAFIDKKILNGEPAGSVQHDGGSAAELPVRRDPYAIARREAAAGKTAQAIEILTRELSHETSERGRFLRRIQIASLMVDNGLVTVAMPLLQQLIDQIGSSSLTAWEDAAVVAQPYALMVRSLDSKQDDREAERREEYYLTVCRLSPVLALGLGSK
jgi:hypothetical protein